MSDSEQTPNKSDTCIEDSLGSTPSSHIPGDDGNSVDSTFPVPSRYRWRKRLFTGFAILVVALFCVRLLWGWDADRQLQKEIDRIAASGEPMFLGDFNLNKHIPDEDNAARVYARAGKSLRLAPRVDGILKELVGDYEAVRAKLQELQKTAEENEITLDLIRRARPLDLVDWHVRMRSPIFGVVADELQHLRDVCRLAGVTALVRQHEGRSRDAFDFITAMQRMARATDAHPSLIGHLYSESFYDVVIQTIEAVLPRLEIGGSAPNAIPKSQIIDLIEQLGDEEASEAAQVLAMQIERAGIVDSICGVANGRLIPRRLVEAVGSEWEFRLYVKAFRPALIEDARFSMMRLGQAVSAARQKTWPQASAIMPSNYPALKGLDFWHHYLSNLWEPTVHRSVILHYRCLAERRMAQIALAIRLFEFDRGELPTSLDRLVPEYLSELPPDPFGDGTRSFGYLRDRAWPRLFSIGLDGIDDGGNIAFKKGGDEINMNVADMPFFLGGTRPKSLEELNTPIPSRTRSN